MLKLKPSCENCDKSLPPDSLEARICSFECTFCSDCVDGILQNVCPNCGGGFVQRPVRPATAWCDGVSLEFSPPVSVKTHQPVNAEKHAEFAVEIAAIPPHKR